MVKYQEYFDKEINFLRQEISALRASSKKVEFETERNYSDKPPRREYAPTQESATLHSAAQNETSPPPNVNSASYPNAEIVYTPAEKSNVEKFIGQNIISLVGIIVTIIGVAIGAKYAIDNNLVSPLIRIVLGYAFGAGLLALAIRLKAKYHDFSAVLLSGAMAIMYFITYFAHAFYNLIPQPIAFALMLLFTVFAVGMAISYNRQVIAHIGLVGAYAVPFLVGGNSENAAVLFSYVAIINLGILAVSLRTYWKSLFFSSFIFTWLIYAAWYLTSYDATIYFTLGFAFLTVFFLTFYFTFIAYKLIAKEELRVENAGLLLANSFVFYGFGAALIQSQSGGGQYQGLFTFANAVLHFAVSLFVRRFAPLNVNVKNFLIVLGLIFITITIPVQLRGNWVVLLWTAKATLLFWFGKSKNLSIYERFSYPLMILASLALIIEWGAVYGNRFLFKPETAVYPVFNATFLVGICYVAAFVLIDFVNRRHKPDVVSDFYKLTSIVFPTVFLAALYNVWRMEIGNYWHYRYVGNTVTTPERVVYNQDLNLFNIVAQIDYSMLFLAVLAVVNLKAIKNSFLGAVNLALNALIMMIFLAVGLFVLSLLRESYLTQAGAEIFARDGFYILIRYISLFIAASLILVSYFYTQREFIQRVLGEKRLQLAFDFGLHISLLWIVSSELLNLTALFGGGESYKLGLSILWGFYSLFLIIWGISRNRKHLRYAAIFLFTVTLFKVFFYDIAELDTISRTIIFVSLGILLLIISFLYTKYKNLIFEESEV